MAISDWEEFFTNCKAIKEEINGGPGAPYSITLDEQDVIQSLEEALNMILNTEQKILEVVEEEENKKNT